ncbi:unnamed protein product (macronuclear) [Paramecium tetraurelia]|uniref:SGS domain-containing protein n=1 Tax=Paramecium tetraurelia TaxID=5888 RepID=A0CW33_PARTE|nr:uncharacterized protein GSPATT00001202001 [Paramecium tetraurelia]CAK75000.1 unnamed protein product [Paramecium tetraurelia]|eukprot:XP_001442397.1 hypothetical protein (macronuclear) [Paramecium tetraurelia strain d4-2]
MDMVRGLNGVDWDDIYDENNKKDGKQENNKDQKGQQENMKQNLEKAIKDLKQEEQFEEKK